ncbi:hypothetical protein G9A89_004087 [Geosiphon pyriformis]|nr:hypothetical protein G9A89_004087 [Geosiphon pyriformis]
MNNGLAGSIITQQLIDQLGHQVDYAASTYIITADGMTKTLISKIDDLPIEPKWPTYANTSNVQLFQDQQRANTDHNKLLLILLWDKQEKKKYTEELTWRTDQNTWNNNNQSEIPLILDWKEKNKGKKKMKRKKERHT